MFKKSSFYACMLLFNIYNYGIAADTKIPDREIIILLETINYETLDKTLNASNAYKYKEILHPVGMGATTISMLIALYQKAAPIIANKSLIKNIIDHQNFFSDFLNLDRHALRMKYGQYDRFQGQSTLDNFRKNCRRTNELTSAVNTMLGNLIKNETNDFNQIMDQIINNQSFQGNAFEDIKNTIADTSTIKSLNLEMRMFTLCSWIDFKKDWQIKQVNDDTFLLIPNNYTKNLNLNLPILQQQQAQFTELELQLGLKIDHMKNIGREFFEQQITSSNQQVSFAKSLEHIFITSDDIKKIGSPQPSKNIWSVYMSGHGLCKHPQLEILPQLYDLKKLFIQKLSSPKFKDCLEHLKNRHKNLNDAHVYNCKHHNLFNKQINKLSMLNKEINKSEKLKHSDSKIDQGMINSLAIGEFKDVLKFLNNNIETAFLYYSSCYSGGPHLTDPYMENGKPLNLKYMIMAGTPAENMSLQEFPFINIPPYFNAKDALLFEPMDITQIDIVNKKLALSTPLKFGQFFELLRKGTHNDFKNLILLPYSLHPHVDSSGNIIGQRIANIPLVRLANADCFQPIPNDNSIAIVDSTTSAKPLVIEKEIALIYSDHIAGKITLNQLGKSQEIPKMLSMVPGFALHAFEEVCSSTLNINEIVNSFLTFPELASAKIFWIKKLECINSNAENKEEKSPKKKIFNDVIIMRNIINSDTLAEYCQSHSIAVGNRAYFSTNTNEEIKVAWNGPLLTTDNYTMQPCDLTEQKEECKNSFPTIASFFSPVLQSI